MKSGGGGEDGACRATSELYFNGSFVGEAFEQKGDMATVYSNSHFSSPVENRLTWGQVEMPPEATAVRGRGYMLARPRGSHADFEHRPSSRRAWKVEPRSLSVGRKVALDTAENLT